MAITCTYGRWHAHDTLIGWGSLSLSLSLTSLSLCGAVVVVWMGVDGWMVFALPIANRDHFRVLCCCCHPLARSLGLLLLLCSLVTVTD